jgi:M6 family metalloprotease-like protein
MAVGPEGRDMQTPSSAKSIVLLCVLVGLTFPLLSHITIQAEQRTPPPQSHGAAVRGLNNALLDVYDRLLNGPASDHIALHGKAAEIIQERAAALQALIQENPGQAVGLAFSQDALDNLGASFPESAGQLESLGSWSGELEYLVQDNPGFRTSVNIQRLKTGLETLDLHFAGNEPDGLVSGVHLRVNGVRAGNQVAAYGNVATSTNVSTSGPMCTTTGPQKSVVLLVTFPGVPAPNITPSAVHDIFFATSGHSVSEYWREASYGATTATGDVFGWYTLDANYTCDQSTSIRDAAIAAADRDVDFTQYNRIFIIFPDGTCSWGGLGSIGCTQLSSAGDGVFTASTAWLLTDYFSNADDGVKLAAHEGGHNLGIHHASTRDFGAEALGFPGAPSVLDEYGDVFSAMSFSLGHYASSHKSMLGWLSEGSGIQTVTTSGSFSVQPLETMGATRALKIRRGLDNNSWLWLEYRTATGPFDSTLSPQVFSGAVIHFEDLTTGIHSHLLDFTPLTTSWKDPALVSGQTWVDSYSNLSISIGNATSTALDVTVNYGSVPCTAANPSMTISPTNPSTYAGNNINYTVSVTNNDSANCSGRSFDLSSLLPGWPTTFSQPSLTIAPGLNGTTTMTKSVPSATIAATYTVDADVTGGTNSASASANLTIMPTPPSLSVTVSVPRSTYATNSSIPISATVQMGNNPALGASVTFTLTNSKGSITKKVTAGSNGVAVWSYKPGPKDPKGAYQVSAKASYNSQTTSTSNVVGFIVN